MSTIHLHHTTTSTPEQLLAALIDFGRAARSSLIKGRALGLVLGTIGKRVLTTAFEHC